MQGLLLLLTLVLLAPHGVLGTSLELSNYFLIKLIT